jgi:hypothetical protein
VAENKAAITKTAPNGIFSKVKTDSHFKPQSLSSSNTSSSRLNVNRLLPPPSSSSSSSFGQRQKARPPQRPPPPSSSSSASSQQQNQNLSHKTTSRAAARPSTSMPTRPTAVKTPVSASDVTRSDSEHELTLHSSFKYYRDLVRFKIFLDF